MTDLTKFVEARNAVVTSVTSLRAKLETYQVNTGNIFDSAPVFGDSPIVANYQGSTVIDLFGEPSTPEDIANAVTELYDALISTWTELGSLVTTNFIAFNHAVEITNEIKTASDAAAVLENLFDGIPDADEQAILELFQTNE